MTIAAVIMIYACGDASRPGDAHEWPATGVDSTEAPLGFGWERPITVANFEPEASTKLGSASQTLAGNTLRAIVTDPSVHVRSDDKACTACHDWAASIERDAFCDRVSAFLAQPTSKATGSDPPNAKPQILKSLLSMWQTAQCPD
jgi:hypothetical protein